ncbi:MAG: hypothetical protein IM561_09080 [Microcystis sp. M60BS1]|uniref:hypothetical protein n=1 Tax=unclassified Microcystis TaxID=2643300 RepID=UPI00257AED23|nr:MULTISPECIES: hypothetical protein [unclassified Microcystis]MCA2594355.1 hypothetical protein [Microcystis sp. M38BS1]MCA6581468.1 hypothetical protein [Pseudanabaena sp. M34BS1SP1A06MG]MCA2510522.1 hypothetical protein [Microcystis sp. M60BS1]MCA2555756.1 hypothetical protein [Microcystis sp. M43BS1]MCA2603415.1 hypothetical protein [Microcystis sp. M26BS1]
MSRRYVEVVYPRTFAPDEDGQTLTRSDLISNASNGQSYVFFTYLEDEFQLGDYAIVSSGPSSELKVVRVIGIWEEPLDMSNYKPLIARLDLRHHFERVKKEKKAVQLKLELNKKLKQVEEFRKFEFLRQYDPEAAAMLDELEALTGIKPGLPPVAAQAAIAANETKKSKE